MSSFSRVVELIQLSVTLDLQLSEYTRRLWATHLAFFTWAVIPSPIWSKSFDCMLEPLCTSFDCQCIRPAGFRVHFTCRHSSTVDWSYVSPTWLAMNFRCFLSDECRHCSTVIESVQCVTVCIWISWSSVISLLNLTECNAVCKTSLGIVCCFIEGNMHLPNAIDNFTPSIFYDRR